MEEGLQVSIGYAKDLMVKAISLSTALLSRRNAQDIARLLPIYIKAIDEFFGILRYEVNKQFYLSLGKEPPSKIEKAERFSSEFVNWQEIEEDALGLLTMASLIIMRQSGTRALSLIDLDGEFDVARTEPVSRAKNRAAWLIGLLLAESMRRIRDIVGRAKREGWGADRVALELNLNIGLSNRQVKGLENLREKLMASGATEAKIQRELGKQSKKSLKQREFTIARTETTKARADGMLMAWKEHMVQHVQYVTTGDPCPICAPFDGNVYTLSEADGMLPIHPNCMCTFVPSVSFNESTIVEE